ETFGSGSAIAVDPKSWVRTPAGYQGTFYMLPDRGFNVTGTSDYRARINKLFITFKPLDDPTAVPVAQRQNSVAATLTDTILLTDAAGQSLTGLDPDGIRRAANGFPGLPQAPNGRVSIDRESLALLADGGIFLGGGDGSLHLSFLASRAPAGGDQAARGVPAQTQGQGTLRLQQSRSRRPGAGTAGPGNRSGEQPGFRRADVDAAGRQISGRCLAERDPPGWWGLAGNAAIFPPRLLRRRRSRTPEAGARIRCTAAAVRDRGWGTAGRGPERAARARRNVLPPALPRFRQRLRHRRRNLTLSQHRPPRHLARDQHRGLALRRHRAG